MAQAIGHKSQALINSETQKKKKRMQKIDFGAAKIYTETINLKTKGTHTSTQTTIVYTVSILRKKTLVTQKIHRSNTSQHRLKRQQKATKRLRQQN